MINEEGESLHDQLMAGLAGNSGETEPETEEETPEGEETTEEEVAPEDEETPEGEETTEEEPEGEENAEDDETEEEGAEEAPEGGKKAAPKKDADPINDPLPKGTLESTRERFQHVVGQLKEQTSRAETAESNLDEIVSKIQEAGMGAEQYGMMLHYAAGVNSGDPVQMKRSYDFLMQELTALGTALGEPLPGKNPLEGHADLIKEVEEKKLDPARAVEIALTRNRAAAHQKLQAARNSTQQGDAAFQQAVQRSVTEFTALGKTLAAKDGAEEYKRKAKFVVDAFQESIMELPPNKRVAAFKRAYDKVPAAPKPQPKPGAGKVPGAKKGITPLRGNKRPSGNSTAKAPKNLLDAMRQGLRDAD